MLKSYRVQLSKPGTMGEKYISYNVIMIEMGYSTIIVCKTEQNVSTITLKEK